MTKKQTVQKAPLPRIRQAWIGDSIGDNRVEFTTIRFVVARNHSQKGRLSGDFEVHPALFEER